MTGERKIMEKTKKKQKEFVIVLAVYLICYAFRVFEYFFLRTDRTWIGEAIIHKLIGIGILFATVRLLQLTMREVGFVREKSLHNLLKGLAFGIGVFAIAYAVEILITVAQGNFDSLQVYVSTYAVDQNIGHKTEIIFFVICIVGNIINVVMEEGIFRGFFQKILEQRYSFIAAAVITSGLFGFWHVVGPVRNYFDGDFGMEGLIANAMMLVITSTLVGFKFVLLTKMTSSLYMSMGDHFVNNTIVNILHVVSDTGIDEMMFVRITVAQSVSFILVIIYFIYWKRKLR